MATGALVGGVLGGSLLQGYFGNKSAQEQSQANAAALAQQLKFTKEQSANAVEESKLGEARALGALRYRDNALSGLAEGQGQSEGILRDFQGRQLSALAGGLGQARADLEQGFNADFQASPGYEFRRQQGEQALNRSAAAQGGRLGGAQLKALAQFNQNLASDEFDRFKQRQFQESGALANLAATSGQQLAGTLGAQGGSLAGLVGQNAASLYQSKASLANDLASLYTGGAAQRVGAYTGAQVPNFFAGAQGAGAGTAAIGQAVGGGLSNLAFLYGTGAFNSPQATPTGVSTISGGPTYRL